MNEQQEKELLEYLSDLGFSGDEFVDGLKQKIRQGMPNFTLSHTVFYGNEKMIFDLSFEKDHKSDLYHLDSYDATLREAPEIHHSSINGIDTAKLEQDFKSVNWNLYFNDPKGALTENDRLQVKALLSDLWHLTAEPSEMGKQIQDVLQYKYWPEHTWNDVAKDLKQTYDWKQSFTVVYHANLTYHMLSGRLDDLYERLSKAGLVNLPGFALQAELEKKLSGNPDRFELKYFRNEPDGFFEYVFPIEKVGRSYTAENYTLTLTPHPPIKHGNFNGIDTAELEAVMLKINWHNDHELFIFHKGSEPEFRPKVGDVQEQMFQLRQDMTGADIADLLQLKYWSDATFFQDMIQQTAWDTFEEMQKRDDIFPIEIDAIIALNLLHGRAAMDAPPHLVAPDDASAWIRLDLEKKEDNGHYPIKRIEGFSKNDLTAMLELLPVSPSDFYPLRNSLLRGDLSPVTLKTEQKVLLKANPEKHTVDVYTPDLRPIPVNLKLDPDWKPAETLRQVSERVTPQQKRQQKSKGRRI